MNDADYSRLHALVFRDGYPGYRPEVREIPNGDGVVDTEKRFAHIATKYLKGYYPIERPELLEYLESAHALAVQVAEALKVPAEFMPDPRYSALRVLDYPAGAGTAVHTDFDLFTVMLYRDSPQHFISDWHNMPEAVSDINAQAHLGELSEILGLGKATSHYVEPAPVPQKSMVYFAFPNHAAVLPTGVTVGDWLAERIARSRVEVQK